MEAVRRYDILDTGPDGAFDRIAAMAAWSAVSGDVQVHPFGRSRGF
ncbi:hypothetical protein ACWGA9_40950 [Streptomyces sp. NPDC054950]